MGCCSGISRKISLKKDISLINLEDSPRKEIIINLKSPFNEFHNIQKTTEKEELKKEKSTNELNILKPDKDELKKEKTKTNSISSKSLQKSEKDEIKKEKNKTNSVSIKTQEDPNKNQLKPNKNKVIKKGSHRVQLAMRQLKLLSLEGINNNKKYFS